MNISDQRLAVARLTTYCERLVQSGSLQPDHELALRALTNITCSVFDMASVADRATVSERSNFNERAEA